MLLQKFIEKTQKAEMQVKITKMYKKKKDPIHPLSKTRKVISVNTFYSSFLVP